MGEPWVPPRWIDSAAVRRGAIIALVLIGIVVSLLTTAIAYFIKWLPAQASEEREGIDFVFWLTTAICIGIFAIVAAVTIYCVWKFRARPDDDSDGTPIHGHTGLEIVWTAVPAVLVTIIAIASAIVVAKNERVGDDPLRIDVTAQQFAWTFKYPDGLISSTLRLPVGRQVLLRLTARDVIHSFWVPEFGQKQDAVPGIFTTLKITPKRVGNYPLPCTELCGVGHALMRSAAIVMPQREYDAWRARERRAREGGGDEEQGQDAGASLFEQRGCGGCHVFTPARSTGTAGPNLDQVEASARRAGKPVEEYVQESIVDPGAYVNPRFPSPMPDSFADLTEPQVDALVQYLLRGRTGERE